MVSSVGLISNRQDQCQLREKFSCPDCDLKKALPISHLSIGIALRCTPEGGCAEASDGFAYRNDLQIADGLAGCFSHSAKNCLRNNRPGATIGQAQQWTGRNNSPGPTPQRMAAGLPRSCRGL
jgi:hypothetical protein